MARKSLGYVELQWTCPNCGTKNPGPQKSCSSCGMPQPEDVEFEQQAQEKIIEDDSKIAQAEAGADIHCYYCGSRNPADAQSCSQCGADLSVGSKRKSGQVLGAHRRRTAEPVECPACGTANESNAPKCVQCGASLVEPQPQAKPPKPAAVAKKKRSGVGLLGGAGLVIVLGLCAAAVVAYFIFASRTEDVTGTVDSANWVRTIAIEGLVPVNYEAWHDEIPAAGVVGPCTQKVRRVQDEPTADSREVCGTPYTEDTGSGFGEVVQDCRYEVLEDFCQYTLEEWQEVDQVSATGDSLTVRWPELKLGTKQREGDRSATYRCIFTTEDGTYTFSTSNEKLYEQCTIGSRWVLRINTFGVINDIEPAN